MTRPEGSAGSRGSRGLAILTSATTWRALCALTAVLAVTLVATARGPEAPQPQPTATATDVRSQGTLLIQVRTTGDLAADNMIAAAGGSSATAQVLVPSRLMVDVPSSGQMPLTQTATLRNRAASQQALSDLLVVRVDGTLSLGRLALVGMVDFVGGITVTVDRQVTATDPGTGEKRVVVPVGTSELSGTQAAAYALMWLPDEPESARLARFSAVMSQTIATLPSDQLRVEQMLTSLGGSARTTATTSTTADLLLRLKPGILQSTVREVPTTAIQDSPLAIVRLDLAGADQVVDDLLDDARLDPDDAKPRVQVSNAVGRAGLGAQARERLVRAGMVYINVGNAAQLGLMNTRILVPDDSSASMALGELIGDALRLPSVTVEVSTPTQVPGEALVLLGEDFARSPAARTTVGSTA